MDRSLLSRLTGNPAVRPVRPRCGPGRSAPKRVSRKDGGGEKRRARGRRERNGGQWLGITSCPPQPTLGIASSFTPRPAGVLEASPHPRKKEPRHLTNQDNYIVQQQQLAADCPEHYRTLQPGGSVWLVCFLTAVGSGAGQASQSSATAPESSAAWPRWRMCVPRGSSL